MGDDRMSLTARAAVASQPCVIDIGGEGRHSAAWNVNPRRYRTCGPTHGEPIPRWILGRADALPLPDHVVDLILVERTPLTRTSMDEIRRVVKLDGTIVLRHARPFGMDPHRVVKTVFTGRFIERECAVGTSHCQELVIQLGHGEKEALESNPRCGNGSGFPYDAQDSVSSCKQVDEPKGV